MREGTYIYLWLIHVDIQQKPTRWYTAIILQLKINNFLKKSEDEFIQIESKECQRRKVKKTFGNGHICRKQRKKEGVSKGTEREDHGRKVIDRNPEEE